MRYSSTGRSVQSVGDEYGMVDWPAGTGFAVYERFRFPRAGREKMYGFGVSEKLPGLADRCEYLRLAGFGPDPE